jgi:hypothetical protein
MRPQDSSPQLPNIEPPFPTHSNPASSSKSLPHTTPIEDRLNHLQKWYTFRTLNSSNQIAIQTFHTSFQFLNRPNRNRIPLDTVDTASPLAESPASRPAHPDLRLRTPRTQDDQDPKTRDHSNPGHLLFQILSSTFSLSIIFFRNFRHHRLRGSK